jgi:hypothetical protein
MFTSNCRGNASGTRATRASSQPAGSSSRWMSRVRRIRSSSHDCGASPELVVYMRKLSAHATSGRNSNWS